MCLKGQVQYIMQRMHTPQCPNFLIRSYFPLHALVHLLSLPYRMEFERMGMEIRIASFAIAPMRSTHVSSGLTTVLQSSRGVDRLELMYARQREKKKEILAYIIDRLVGFKWKLSLSLSPPPSL